MLQRANEGGTAGAWAENSKLDVSFTGCASLPGWAVHREKQRRGIGRLPAAIALGLAW